MQKNTIHQSLIEGIIESSNDDFVENVKTKVENLMAIAIDDLSQQISYINFDNIILQPANELLTDAMTDNSVFTYFLGIRNSQIEMNTLRSGEFWKNVKNRIVYAWKTRNKKKKTNKKKEKEKLKDVEPIAYDFNPANYNLYHLARDIQTAVCKQLSMSSLVYLESNRIRILGKEDFGPNTQIIIYPVLLSGDDFKYYAGKKRGFVAVNFDKRVEAIQNKIDRVGYNYINIIKVFNSLWFNINKTTPNQIFIESLLYHCPDNLFEEENGYKSFIKVLNYLTMSDVKDFCSIVNPNQTIFKDIVCGNSAYHYKRFLDELTDLQK